MSYKLLIAMQRDAVIFCHLYRLITLPLYHIYITRIEIPWAQRYDFKSGILISPK